MNGTRRRSCREGSCTEDGKEEEETEGEGEVRDFVLLR